jgi:hypothetical protein
MDSGRDFTTIVMTIVIIIAMTMMIVVVMMVMMRAHGENLQFLTEILMVLLCEFPAKSFS